MKRYNSVLSAAICLLCMASGSSVWADPIESGRKAAEVRAADSSPADDDTQDSGRTDPEAALAGTLPGRPMSLEEFQRLAMEGNPRSEAVALVTDVHVLLVNALTAGLITPDAFRWGWVNHYIPLISRANKVVAVCGF